MIDLETFSAGENACVVQIGACDFQEDQQFKRNIDARDAFRNGATIDPDTIYWWLSQSDGARSSVCQPGVTEREAFEAFNDYLADADEIWSHATFDFVIVMSALRRLNIKPKFSYRAARDIRTLIGFSKIDTKKKPRGGIHHDALADAIYQAGYCRSALAVIGVD